MSHVSCVRNLTFSAWRSNNIEGRIPVRSYTVPSPAWVDPRGRLVVSEHELRPFPRPAASSNFYLLFNTLEPERGFRDLAQFAVRPAGMAWSVNNDTVYYADAFHK